MYKGIEEMTQRESFEFSELCEEIFKEYNYLCAACGEPVTRYGRPQIAHRIAQSLANVDKFGKSVIHHRLNLRPVCCLKCNDYFNIGFDTCAAEKLADEIRDQLLKE